MDRPGAQCRRVTMGNDGRDYPRNVPFDVAYFNSRLGVREAATVTALGLLQVPTQTTLTASVGFGLSNILASLPGIMVLLTAQPLQKPPIVNAPASIRSPEHSK